MDTQYCLLNECSCTCMILPSRTSTVSGLNTPPLPSVIATIARGGHLASPKKITESWHILQNNALTFITKNPFELRFAKLD